MKRWVKIIALSAAAPVVWFAGELLLLALTPAYVVARPPLPVSQSDVSAQEVAELNARLQGDGMQWWSLSLTVRSTAEDVMLVVPGSDGGLELLQVRPFCAWREGAAELSARRQQVLESWLHDKKGKTE